MDTYLNIFKRVDKLYVDTQKALKIINVNFSFSDLLKEIINNEKWALTISAKSYSHSNGFDKLNLFSGENIKIRLHIYWNNQNNNPISDIHDHRWNFSSLIIKGSYINETYEINDNGKKKFLYHYFSNAKPNFEFQLEYIKPTNLNLKSTRKLSEKDINNGLAGEIHKVMFNNEKLTITLFITSNYERPYARVFTEKKLPTHGKLKSKELKLNSLLKKLNSLLKNEIDQKELSI